MYPSRCDECGGEVRLSREPIPVEFRNETIMVGGIEHARCKECAETYLGPSELEQLQKGAAAQYRRARGLLTPDEILELRTSLRMSQPAFEKLLSVGPKTVIRWEKGTVVQSATADRLMFVLREMPEVVDLLLNERPAAEKFHTPMPVPATSARSAKWHRQSQPALHLDSELTANECHSLAA
jgi:HTH-type transcriptional regulator/antitoxin MqsA